MQSSHKLTRVVATSIASFGLVVAAMGAAQAAPADHAASVGLGGTTSIHATHTANHSHDTGW